jgi:hypothetical protein
MDRLYSVFRIDKQNRRHLHGSGLSLEDANRLRNRFFASRSNQDYVIQPEWLDSELNSPAPNPAATPETN